MPRTKKAAVVWKNFDEMVICRGGLADKMKKEDMNIVIVGHVDHGKSTLMGRLLADTDSLPEGKLEQVKETCRRNAKPFEYAFLLDALKDEQAQGITIDTARCFFKTEKRDYIILDAPGHIEFLKNMITGASRAEAALLMIDAKEGVQENSRRHAYMLSMLGIHQIAVVINKMDLVDYSQDVYEKVKKEYLEFLKQIHIEPKFVLPVSSFMGENIVKKSDKMPWYQGDCVLEVLDHFECEKPHEHQAFRMPVQDVYKFTGNGDDRRIVAGTVETGKIHPGDEVVFYPSGKRSHVKNIEVFHAETPKEAVPGMATGFTLKEQIYIKRGELMCIAGQQEPKKGTRIQANLFWLGRENLVTGKSYILKIGSEKVRMKVESILRVIDSSNLNSQETKDYVGKNEVAQCVLKTDRPIAYDVVKDNAGTSRFVIVDDYEIAGGGIVTDQLPETPAKNENVVWHDGKVSKQETQAVLGQSGLVVWFTGLSGAGKSTIAVEVEKQLTERKKACYRLDGDNLRFGINSDLGFTDEDRQENVRRIAEVAALFQDAGMITLVSCISPFREKRQFARERVPEGRFLEVYVKADINTCMDRDPKGLYKKQIQNFTGKDSTYEEPHNPELVLDTVNETVEECAAKVLDQILLYSKEE